MFEIGEILSLPVNYPTLPVTRKPCIRQLEVGRVLWGNARKIGSPCIPTHPQDEQRPCDRAIPSDSGVEFVVGNGRIGRETPDMSVWWLCLCEWFWVSPKESFSCSPGIQGRAYLVRTTTRSFVCLPNNSKTTAKNAYKKCRTNQSTVVVIIIITGII